MAALPDFYRGDTQVYNLSFTDNSSGSAVDITGNDLWITLKVSLNDSDEDAAFQKQITFPPDSNSAQGVGQIILESSETKVITPGTYFYDFQYVVPGSPPHVTTLTSGKVTVLPDITLRDTAS
ncbi:hypothetical protein ACQZV8_13270 [Magnetococcales bacterium HHB-1]